MVPPLPPPALALLPPSATMTLPPSSATPPKLPFALRVTVPPLTPGTIAAELVAAPPAALIDAELASSPPADTLTLPPTEGEADEAAPVTVMLPDRSTSPF